MKCTLVKSFGGYLIFVIGKWNLYLGAEVQFVLSILFAFGLFTETLNRTGYIVLLLFYIDDFCFEYSRYINFYNGNLIDFYGLPVQFPTVIYIFFYTHSQTFFRKPSNSFNVQNTIKSRSFLLFKIWFRQYPFKI